MKITVTVSSPGEVTGLRTRFRLESSYQIVHDSLQDRAGWTITYLLYGDDCLAGFGSIAIAGPWKDKPTIYEYYLLPDYRVHALRLFEAFLEVSQARYFEVQSNQLLLSSMLFRYAENIRSEAMVFYDHQRTYLSIPGASLELKSSQKDLQTSIARRRGCGQWELVVEGEKVGSGGICFHYNRPYGDVHMEILEAHRQRGYGAYLVQELKRICYELDTVPAARCNPTNVASQLTLQKAGFVPYAHILDGELKPMVNGSPLPLASPN